MRGSVMGTAVTLAAGALLAASMSTASAGPPDTAAKAQPRQPVLVDCQWNRDVRPTDFILACGDGNSRLAGLNWTHWGGGRAKAAGVNWVNDCKPYCAAGRFHPYPVVVRLDRPEPWKKHPDVQHFTRMTLTYDNARPDGFPKVVTYPLWD
ncbi:hypothetical protein [Streptomyces collinus]|uniref:hypothetical protein n=1 Tax=Streptomyces collinus TaxID=42684 RepID=UPI00368F6D2A